MKKIITGKAVSIVISLLAMTACLPVAACGGGSDVAVQTGVTATGTGTTEDTTEIYIGDVRDLAANANGVNTDYRKLLEKYGSGTVSKEEVTDFAAGAKGEFEFMGSRLQEMEPPAGLGPEHQQLISAFDKWRQFYQLQIDGLNNNDNALLESARDLDNQAATEVNDAIQAINDKQAGQ
jgi:hypothetical protein